MTILLTTLLLLTGLYVLVTTGLALGLGRRAGKDPDFAPSVSVVVCAHNEADRIGSCLAAIAAQTYDDEQTEIILVDDRSTDATEKIARSWTDRIPQLKILPVTENRLKCPKKNALSHGRAVAGGQIILTTDADCVPSPDWIASTVASFSERVGVVIGPAPLTNPGSRFSPLLIFQSLLVNALAAGSAGIGIPLTCSGRNFAFRKTAFDQVGGYEPIGNIIGGDDVLLMRRIRECGWAVVFNQDETATVASPAHVDRIWSRQVRYQSKARYYGLRILSVAVLIYILHVMLLATPIWIWLAPETFPILLSVLAVKAAADGLFLWRAARRLGYHRTLRWFPIIEILAIPYIAVFCALGTLRSSSWN